MVDKWLDKLRWLGHDSFVYAGPPVVYFDPWRLDQVSSSSEDLPTADLVLVSHEPDRMLPLVTATYELEGGTLLDRMDLR